MRTTQIHNWYFNAIPTHHKNYIKFLSNARELGHEDITQYVASQSKHSVPYDNCAYIPLWVLDDDIFGDDVSDSDQRALQTAFWNHSILMNKQLFGSPESYQHGNYQHQLTPDLTIMEYVLSLHANEQLQHSPYGCFTDVTNEFMYSANTLLYAVDLVNITDGQEGLGKVLEHYLNPALRPYVRQVMGDEIADILDKVLAYKGNTTKGLARLCNLLYDVLFNNDQEQPPQPGPGEPSDDEDSEQQSGSGEGDSSDEQENEGDSTSSEGTEEETDNESDKDEKPSDQNNGSDHEGQGSSNSSGEPEQANDWQQGVEPEPDILQHAQLTEEMTQALEELNNSLSGGGWDQVHEKKETVNMIDALTIRRSDYRRQTTIQESDAFANLGKLLRQIKVVRENYIDPQLYGGDLLEDELFRVVTDRRVMGLLDEQQEPVVKEWRIVCDLSGSTMSSYEGSYNQLWQQELEAAKGMFLSLRDAREDVVVYGHHAQYTTDIYHIAANKDTELDTRFNNPQHILRVGYGNYDEQVIEHIARHEFTYPDSMKIIIMISDGRPCGLNGMQNTKDVVDLLRKRGFMIISFSIVAGVVKNNNWIYGEQWNIDASHGDLDDKLRELAVRMSSEFKVRK